MGKNYQNLFYENKKSLLDILKSDVFEEIARTLWPMKDKKETFVEIINMGVTKNEIDRAKKRYSEKESLNWDQIDENPKVHSYSQKEEEFVGESNHFYYRPNENGREIFRINSKDYYYHTCYDRAMEDHVREELISIKRANFKLINEGKFDETIELISNKGLSISPREILRREIEKRKIGSLREKGECYFKLWDFIVDDFRYVKKDGFLTVQKIPQNPIEKTLIKPSWQEFLGYSKKDFDGPIKRRWDRFIYKLFH